MDEGGGNGGREPAETAKRADGELSRERILDAATEIAAERGYEGTSIALVSDKCGLPASSIYWHFTNKDDLIAAVIERSFADWAAAWQVPDEWSPRERLVGMALQIAKALLDSPDFIRLGLMLALERRPVEPRARAMFIQTRIQTSEELAETMRGFEPRLTEAQIRQLVTTRWPAPMGSSSPRRSAATQWICWSSLNCTPARCTTRRCA